MTMNIRIMNVAAAAAALRMLAWLPGLALVACTDSYPKLESDDDYLVSNDETYNLVPIMLFINEQDYFSVSATRGTGPFEEGNTEKYFNSTFYVFSFRDGCDEQGALAYETDFTKTRYADGYSSTEYYDPESADCLVDGTDYRMGMSMYPSADNAGGMLQTHGIVMYYPSVYQDVGYNFFAYYIDDIEPTQVNRTESGISYDVEIDGTQDIMCGMAPKLTSEVLDNKIAAGLTISDDERTRILNIGNYSTYAARRSVNPEIELEHELTQLRFVAYPGDNRSGSITITGISVNSRYKGTMTVASRDTDYLGMAFSDERTDLELCEASVDGVTSCAPLESYTIEWDESMSGTSWQNRPSVDVGGCLLLAPDSVYTLTLYYTQTITADNGGTEEVDLRTVYTLKADNSSYYYDGTTGNYIFRPGYVYTVRIGVYGLQEISVSVNIAGWQDGGDVTLDPDSGESTIVG